MPVCSRKWRLKLRGLMCSRPAQSCGRERMSGAAMKAWHNAPRVARQRMCSGSAGARSTSCSSSRASAPSRPSLSYCAGMSTASSSWRNSGDTSTTSQARVRARRPGSM